MEDEKIVTLQLRLTRRKALAILAGFFLCWRPGSLGSEQLTLTTYYPAPYGGYASLLTTSQTLLARDGGNVGIGTSSPVRKLDVRFTNTDTGRLVDIGNYNGSFGGLSIGNNGSRNYVGFTASGADDMVIDSLGDVGIGTTNPGQKLEVSGSARVSVGAAGTGKLYTASDIRVGYFSDAGKVGTNIGDLYVNGYFRDFCRRVPYTVGGSETCDSNERIVGFMGDGCASRPTTCVSGFLPLNASDQAHTSAGKYIRLGADWGGVMICCRMAM